VVERRPTIVLLGATAVGLVVLGGLAAFPGSGPGKSARTLPATTTKDCAIALGVRLPGLVAHAPDHVLDPPAVAGLRLARPQ
jgi:hypothetical protein